MPWELLVTEEFERWWDALTEEHQDALTARIAVLRDHGPAVGRPTVDTIAGSRLANLKELRATLGRAHLRVLFVFDPAGGRCCSSGATKPGSGSRGTDKRSHEQKSCMPGTSRR